jgi:hypothetical protein
LDAKLKEARTRADSVVAKKKYEEIDLATKALFRQKRREHYSRIVERIPTASRNNDPRSMYRNIREASGGFKQRTNLVKDNEENLLTNPVDLAERWKQ